MLVVDDDAVTRHILFDYLQRAGYQPLTASSGQEALERIKTVIPSLVLLDLVLPDADGYEVLRAIRADERVRDTPVVVLTALEGDEEIARAFEEGADDFLHKPFRNAELVARIRGQLRLRGYLVELAQKERDAAVLVELTQALASSLDIREILHMVVRRIAETVDVDRCSIIVAREGGGRGYVVAASDDAGVQNLPIELEKYPEIQTVLQTREPLTIEDARTHPLLDPVRATARFQSLTLLPIAHEERALGVLFLRSIEGRGRLEDRELSFCQIAANATAVALRNARVLQQLRDETQALDSRAAQAETRVRSLEQYQVLFRSAADGMLVFDRRGTVRFVNPRGAEILEYSADKIVGRPAFERVISEDLPAVDRAIESVRGGGTTSLDVRFRRRRGSVGTLAIALSSLESDDDAQIVSFRDVTQDRENARELSRTRDFLTSLIESSPDAIVAADMRGMILIWNRTAERVCGVARDEVVGRINVSAIYPPTVAQEIMRRLRESERTEGVGRVESFRTELVTPSGEQIPILLSAAIVREGEKDFGTVGIFSDLRDRIHMEQRLAAAQEQLKLSEKQALVARVAGTAAHELNQPLQSILGNAEIMMRRLQGDAIVDRYASMIIQEADRMKDIVRKLGNMTRLETIHYVGNTQIFDLNANAPESPDNHDEPKDTPPTGER
ncbi:MAG: PAS domain S-box protein [Myxococcales bacterium]|nr:PAS domain S-box protein [Myxococcales bacterium]